METTPLSPRVSDVSSNESAYLRGEDFLASPSSASSQWDDEVVEEENKWLGRWSGKVRHAVGITLLLATVFLWTASNFLASVCSLLLDIRW